MWSKLNSCLASLLSWSKEVFDASEISVAVFFIDGIDALRGSSAGVVDLSLDSAATFETEPSTLAFSKWTEASACSPPCMFSPAWSQWDDNSGLAVSPNSGARDGSTASIISLPEALNLRGTCLC